MPTDAHSFLQIANVGKSFGAVQVLRDISATFPLGRVTALVGDNGAGKSTLVGILSGLHKPSSGALRVEDRPTEFNGPRDAMAAGIETVFQNLALISNLDVTENIFLGRERRYAGLQGGLGFVDRRSMRSAVENHISREGLDIPVHGRPVGSLSGGQRQVVAVLRATFWGAKFVILDEPTAALGVRQRTLVLDHVRRLRNGGLGVLLISHNLEEVLSVVDHVVALRLGRKCVDAPTSQVTHASLVLAMSGLVAESAINGRADD
jgi:simple sugar transport system ATP-binding protein